METKAIENAAFDIIYEENAESVYRTALHYSGNHHAAEEITQTVFMKLYMNLEHINKKAVSLWLLTTAKHAAMNYNRGKKREVLLGKVVYDSREEYITDSLEDEFMRKLCKEEYRELTENIFADLYQVNPRWYDALTITYFLEKPQKEVADIMGVKLEVLHSMLYRAKQWIRKNYEEQFDHLKE